MKKLMLLLTCCLLLAPCAMAEIDTRTDEQGPVYAWRYFHFEGEVPEVLMQPLREAGYDPQTVLCGALRKAVRSSPAATTAADRLMDVALLAIDRGDAVTLVGMVASEGEHYRFVDLGEKMLLKDRDFRILFRRQGNQRDLMVEYAPQDGVTERYFFRPGVDVRELWAVEGYEREAADGSGYRIVNEYAVDGFAVLPLGAHPFDVPATPANWIGLAAYMDDIADFPTTEAAVKQRIEESWQGLENTDIVMLYGDVNLRERPTGSSASLGCYHTGTLAHELGQERGRETAWIHVRVGGREGYVSGVYVRRPRAADWPEALWHTPLPMARTNAAVTLRALPGRSEAAVDELPAGALLRVMAGERDGWLHVSVPQGDVGISMDVDDPAGYLPAADVTFVSAVTLD